VTMGALTRDPAIDGRPALATLYGQFERLVEAGWTRTLLTSQHDASGEALPVFAYQSAGSVDLVLIGGIHGREPAGTLALAGQVERLCDLGRTRAILLMPQLNPWGYLHHQRYGPSGQSVSDSDHLLGRAEAPACPEADAITAFVMDRAGIQPGATVLDLHEDPVYEAPDYVFEGQGSYLYVTGAGALNHATTRRIIHCLTGCALPLILEGVTRFHERLNGGVIVDTEDGSIDELLARRKACSPVITTELVLKAKDSPNLATRIATYRAVIDAFFAP